jgi:hypothetical protein
VRHYEKVPQIEILPAGTGGQNGVTHERTKSGNPGNQRGVPQSGQERKGLDTRTVTGICSGWQRFSGRLNKAPTGTPEALKSTGVSSPFKIAGFHSDTGSEFIYRHTINGRETVKTLGLSLNRSSHKNALPAAQGDRDVEIVLIKIKNACS